MVLLQLSSITGGWVNIGLSIANQPVEMSIGEAAFFGALAAGGLAVAKADPHWAEMVQDHHFDHIDDDCARLAHLSDEERADLESTPDDRKEFARRMITSHRFERLLSRLHQQSRRLTTA